VDVKGKPLKIIACQKKTYTLQAKGRHQRRVAAYILTSQSVRIYVYSNLFVRTDLSSALRDKINRLFKAYDYQHDGDPIKYAINNMAPDVTQDMFSVLPSYELEKIGTAQVNDEQEKDLLAYVTGGINGKIVPSSETLEAFMKDMNFNLIWLKTETVYNLPDKADSGEHRIQTDNPDNPTPIDPIINQDAKGLDCTPDKTERAPILVLFTWPEFKIEWRDTRIDIGCGVTMVVTLPVLFTRMSRIVLWVALAHPKDFDNLLVRQLVDCLIRASLAAVVVGLALEDIDSACAAFDAVFYAQLAIYVGHDVTCLLPELFVLTDNSHWQRR
jgi:hypothetical protein